MHLLLLLLLLLPGAILFSARANAEEVTPAEANTARLYVEKKMGTRIAPPVISQDPATYVQAVHDAHEPFGRATAAYRSGTIYLPQSFDAKTDMPELVHEMVHHAQDTHHLRYACEAAKEEQAYAIENHYIHEAGVDRPELKQSVAAGGGFSTKPKEEVCARPL